MNYASAGKRLKNMKNMKKGLLILLAVLVACVSFMACGSSNKLGKGKTAFTVKVTYEDGKTEDFEIHTDEETVGAALVALKFIEGEDSEYGLYIKKVNGVTADYDVDGTYWAFYINGESAMTSADQTPAENGAVYEFKVEKF